MGFLCDLGIVNTPHPLSHVYPKAWNPLSQTPEEKVPLRKLICRGKKGLCFPRRPRHLHQPAVQLSTGLPAFSTLLTDPTTPGLSL